MDAVAWNRFQFAFTATYHYLFPQLTMGLALLIVVFKWIALKRGDEHWHEVARFWGRLFGINFAVGVVTGIPMEFQFGTNWGRFANFGGGVVGVTLAMEGMFAFFAESAFLGLFLFGEKRLSPKAHMFSAVMLWLGSWLSGYFIIVTNAFMQHPVGHAISKDGALQLANFWRYLFNPWAIAQYAHNMCAAVVTGSFVVCAVGAFYTLSGKAPEHARIFLRVGVTAAFVASILQIFPTGDHQGKAVSKYQPAALAAMEGQFESGPNAPVAIIGQPDIKNRKLENPVVVPGALSFLAYGSFGSNVTGLNDIPRDRWPDNVELLYYCYHIMVGLGTLLLAVAALAFLLERRGTLQGARPVLWILMFAFPFPYIATTCGWMTAELGRQPWLVYGLQRTLHGTSPLVSGGNVVFSVLGFMGMYFVIGVLYLYLIMREIGRGPEPERVIPLKELDGGDGRKIELVDRPQRERVMAWEE